MPPNLNLEIRPFRPFGSPLGLNSTAVSSSSAPSSSASPTSNSSNSQASPALSSWRRIFGGQPAPATDAGKAPPAAVKGFLPFVYLFKVKNGTDFIVYSQFNILKVVRQSLSNPLHSFLAWIPSPNPSPLINPFLHSPSLPPLLRRNLNLRQTNLHSLLLIHLQRSLSNLSPRQIVPLSRRGGSNRPLLSLQKRNFGGKRVLFKISLGSPLRPINFLRDLKIGIYSDSMISWTF